MFDQREIEGKEGKRFGRIKNLLIGLQKMRGFGGEGIGGKIYKFC